MAKETPTPSSRLNPPQPNQGATVARAFEGMDSILDRVIAELYSFASMLVGESEETIRLVETSIASAEVSAGSGADGAQRSSRLALASAAVDLISGRDPQGLSAPADLEHAVTCIEDDDLDAAAEAREAMERMIAGPDRDRVRAWLESLPTAMRTIYALRAVGGLTASETADILVRYGGPRAAGWTPEAVRELFRQALCSLASQLIHATAR